jgi:hypothetical protein
MRQNVGPWIGSRRRLGTERLLPAAEADDENHRVTGRSSSLLFLHGTSGDLPLVAGATSLPTTFTSTEETAITTQHSTAITESGSRPEQPAPWSTPGKWTITTVNGLQTSGYLPAWAEDDPSEVGVPLEMLGVRLADVSHRGFFEGQIIDVVAPDAHGKAEEEAVFEVSIDCTPYAEDPELRVPVANIQAYPERWILGLDPTGVAEVAAKLRAQADRLDHEVHPALIAARADWAAHHQPRLTGHHAEP